MELTVTENWRLLCATPQALQLSARFLTSTSYSLAKSQLERSRDVANTGSSLRLVHNLSLTEPTPTALSSGKRASKTIVPMTSFLSCSCMTPDAPSMICPYTTQAEEQLGGVCWTTRWRQSSQRSRNPCLFRSKMLLMLVYRWTP